MAQPRGAALHGVALEREVRHRALPGAEPGRNRGHEKERPRDMAPAGCGESYDSADAQVGGDDSTDRLTQLRGVVEKCDQDRSECHPGEASKVPSPTHNGAHKRRAAAQCGWSVAIEKPWKDALLAKIRMSASNKYRCSSCDEQPWHAVPL